jgi:hypothetical protein
MRRIILDEELAHPHGWLVSDKEFADRWDKMILDKSFSPMDDMKDKIIE